MLEYNLLLALNINTTAGGIHQKIFCEQNAVQH